MSLVGDLRHDILTQKNNELSRIATEHATALLQLFRVHNAVSQNGDVGTFLSSAFDLNNITEEEALFLKKNDLSNGLSFDPNQLVLPTPPLETTTQQREDASIYVSKPSSGLSQSFGGIETNATDSTAAIAGVVDSSPAVLTSTDPVVAAEDDQAIPKPSKRTSLEASKASTPRQASVSPDDQEVAPAQVAPPLPEEEANLSAATQQLVDSEVGTKPAKTVHLPSEEEQERRLHEREAAIEQRRILDLDLKSSQRLAAPQGELASSPSSTVGAYSAATPQPPQESPDTSPDSDQERIEAAPPKVLQLSEQEQREQEEHDRILEAQKEIARKHALGDVPETPDEQLKWEEREAAAREAEERAAREAVAGPEPDTKHGRVSTEAEQAVEEMQVDSITEPTQTLAAHDKEVSGGQAKADSKALVTTGDDENTTAAAPPKPSQPIVETPHLDEVASMTEKQSTPARRGGMTTRVSSGAMRQKSVSEILGQSQSPPPDSAINARKAMFSSEPVSPLTQRHPHDNASVSAVARQLPRTPLPHRTPSLAASTLEQLETLKGASEDPEKDYLEPLFRIQAHEAQNSGTRTLGDLIKVGVKVLSTEDQFTAIHERMDFRMLRRVYQLQNANKWSLRQMEKAKEPEQPVTHHDHLMQEMKWMRKDFRAERKTKKNVCTWLAQRCAEWVAASFEERQRLQVKVKPPGVRAADDATEVPDLEHSGDSAPEDEVSPPTPRAGTPLPQSLVITPELSHVVQDLQKAGRLSKALALLPKTGLLRTEIKHEVLPVTLVSKFVEGKVLPTVNAPPRKRSRYDYEDEAEVVDGPSSKRLREAQQFPAEDTTCALFDPTNKMIRDRLHSNQAFRPPSEYMMPSTSFYEYRSGSQWIWEDDQKLRKLAKEYVFNWSLIADELALPTRYKSSAERRTPWECFERWVELESLPAEMRKTVYFKTWFQRLEQSQQAAERRYQAQVAHIQAQAAQNGGPTHVPLRRRTTPTRVEKRRSTRYLWMVDGFRKLAKKREQAAWKQAETARAAAQRKSATEQNPPPKTVKMTPQEFSKKRHERDMQVAEQVKQHRQKMFEAQQRQIAAARAAQAQQQGGMPNAVPQQQRPPGQQPAMLPNGQPASNAGQNPAQQQGRVQMAPQRNGHLAPPQVNAQGIPQASMQARPGMAPHPNMQQMPPTTAQGRNSQYANQQYSMQNGGNIPSPGGNMTTAQQLQQNQALLQAYHQQQANGGQAHSMNTMPNNQQMSASSPSMPPPPTPQSAPQQLSSGHVPQIIAIQNSIRAQNPGISEENLKLMATQQMTKMSQSTSQARQNAMNAAAGITPSAQNGVQQQYANNQAAYQRNGAVPNAQVSNNVNGTYVNGAEGAAQPANMSPAPSSSSPSQQQVYAQKLQWQQRQLMQQQMQMQSPNTSHAQLNGSPSVNHASPSMTPASPNLQYSNVNPMNPAISNGVNNTQRPPSRNNTPQMQRVGSSGSGVAISNGMPSPGAQMQGSPRNMQASMAR